MCGSSGVGWGDETGGRSTYASCSVSHAPGNGYMYSGRSISAFGVAMVADKILMQLVLGLETWKDANKLSQTNTSTCLRIVLF